MISKVYSIWFKFTRKFNDVRENWRSGLSSGSHAEVRTSVRTTLFCKNTDNAVKINNSPRFTAFTAKRCKKYAVKIIFFHRLSPHFLRDFIAILDPGWQWKFWLNENDLYMYKMYILEKNLQQTLRAELEILSNCFVIFSNVKYHQFYFRNSLVRILFKWLLLWELSRKSFWT